MPNATATQTRPQIDTTTPTFTALSETPSTGDLGVGGTVTLTLTPSEAVTLMGTPELILNDGTNAVASYDAAESTATSLAFDYTVAAGQTTAALAATAVNLNDGTIENGAGTPASLSLAGLTQTGPQIDTTIVAAVAASPSSGDQNTGAAITLTLSFSNSVTVTGTPLLTLNDGGTAIYKSGSGSNTLVFAYTVANAQNTSALVVTGNNLNGSTINITNASGGQANLSGADVSFPSLAIGVTVKSITSAQTSSDLGPGKVVTFTVTTTEAVKITGGTPTLSLNDGGIATYNSGSGKSALTFAYTVGALGSGQNTPALAVTGFNPNGATIYDSNVLADTANLLGVTAFATGPQIDTIAPTVLSVAASPANGDLNAGKSVTLTVAFSENVIVAGSPYLSLNDGGNAKYTSGSNSNALTFTYTVAAGQSTSDLTVLGLNLNGGLIKDGAGNNAVVTGAVTNPIGILQIDTTSPKISSVTTSGPGIFTSSTTLFLTLNDGGVATYIGGSGTSALSFAYTVGALGSGQNTPNLALAASNALSLNGATITDEAGNAAILTGANNYNPAGTLQIDTTAPTVTKIVASPASGEVTTGHVVKITFDTSEAVTVTGTPELLLNDGGMATYAAAGSGSTSKALVFDYTVASGDVTTNLAVSGMELPSASAIADLAGNNANLAGAGANLGLQINTKSTGTAGPSGGNFTIGGSTELDGAVAGLSATLSISRTSALGTLRHSAIRQTAQIPAAH